MNTKRKVLIIKLDETSDVSSHDKISGRVKAEEPLNSYVVKKPCNRLSVAELVAAMYSLVFCIVLINGLSQLNAFPSSTLPRLSDSSPIKIKLLSQDTISKTLTNRIRRKVPASSYFLSKDTPISRIGGSGAAPPAAPPPPPPSQSFYRPGSPSSQSDTYRPDGSFSYSYNTDNGISTNVKGYQKNVSGNQGQAMEGQFSYTSPEGRPILTLWYADETGFHAQGAHLPLFTLRNG
ncbi:Insect cuticle protein [Homalodisca vitripennis]|nr:Insect cuticle protein [Homalodisca vitripennis]